MSAPRGQNVKDADRESGRERPILFSGRLVRALLEGRKSVTRRVIRNPGRLEGKMLLGEEPDWCPYGAPGDRLWVRETWALPPNYDRERHGDLTKRPRIGPVCYREGYPSWDPWPGTRWRPSIHMPRWASRILLEVTEVRVERLNDMTADEAKAEGVPSRGIPEPCIASALMYLEDFARLWDELNAPRGYGWDANPWVFVIRFRRIKP